MATLEVGGGPRDPGPVNIATETLVSCLSLSFSCPSPLCSPKGLSGTQSPRLNCMKMRKQVEGCRDRLAPTVGLVEGPQLGSWAASCLSSVQGELNWAMLDWNRPEVCEQASGHQISFGSS